MPRYLVRVVLLKAEPAEYPDLHENMKNAGFRQTIVLDGGTYRLPVGQYQKKSEGGGDSILDAVKSIVKKSSERRYRILVSKSERVWSLGLERTSTTK